MTRSGVTVHLLLVLCILWHKSFSDQGQHLALQTPRKQDKAILPFRIQSSLVPDDELLRQVSGATFSININGVGTCMVIPNLRCFCCQFQASTLGDGMKRPTTIATTLVESTTTCTISVPNTCTEELVIQQLVAEDGRRRRRPVTRIDKLLAVYPFSANNL